MKKSEIKPALEALKEIKVHKFEDKEIRNLIIGDHFALLDVSRTLDAKIEDMRKVFLESYKEEEQIIQDLQTQIGEASTRAEQIELSQKLRQEHKGYLDAVKAFNEQVAELYSEEFEIKPVDREKLMNELIKLDLKLSWVEALYPLFNR